MWINTDDLTFLKQESPEWVNLSREGNFVNSWGSAMPFKAAVFDGILLSHVLEHMDCHACVKVLKECHRILKPEGVVRISIPCAKKFHDLTTIGFTAWGEGSWNDSNPSYSRMTFMEYALFFLGHVQVMSLDSIKCMLYLAGFRIYEEKAETGTNSWIPEITTIDNRQVFSAFMEAKK
jgi:predicted SAM-dependent methyltransferase